MIMIVGAGWLELQAGKSTIVHNCSRWKERYTLWTWGWRYI